MASERTDAEIFAATLPDYQANGKAAFNKLFERSALDFVRLAGFISHLPEGEFERLVAEHAGEADEH